MFRVLYGLTGPEGDAMREAELSVYDGIPFSNSGRKKIGSTLETSPTVVVSSIIGLYWRTKLVQQNNGIVKRKLEGIDFIFNRSDLEYYKIMMKRTKGK